VRETTVEEHLIDGVRARGGMCIKWTGSAGVPDRLIVLRARMLPVETKAPGGRLRPDQIVMHKRLAQRGVPVAVLSSTDEVDAWLDSLDTAS
jgi:hypothetical protein